MRIAVFAPVFWPYRGGMGRVVDNEVKELQKNDCQVDIFTPRYSCSWLKEEEWFGSKIYRLEPLLKFGNAAVIKIKKEVELQDYDILHLHYPFIGGVKEALRFKKEKNLPLVVTYHMDLVARGWRGLFFKIYSWLTLPKIFKNADRIVFSSLDYGQNSFFSNYLKKQPNKFSAIPFGVEKKELKMSPTEVRDQLGLNQKEKIILFVGALDKAHYFKGLDVLFSALKKINKEQTGFKAVVIGDGELKNKYQKKAQRFNLDKQIIFKGLVSDEDLIKYYRAADLLILPSITASEAYGMVVIEAAGQGLLSVVSNLPGVREQVASFGKVFKLGDSDDLSRKILDILSNESNFKKMSEEAEKWAQKNRSVTEEARQLADVYKLVAKKKHFC